MNVKRVLAASGAAALVASGMVLGLSTAAFADPTMTVTPNSNLKDGDVVTVTVKGYSPNAPVAMGVCPTGRDLKGAGDCGPSKSGASKLTAADATGSVTAKLTVIKGPLGNLTPPKASCPPCSIGSANIANAKEKVAVPLNYAKGSAAVPPPSADPPPAAPLPKTGPRETLIVAILGFALLQVGLVFAVRASRAAPRRTAA